MTTKIFTIPSPTIRSIRSLSYALRHIELFIALLKILYLCMCICTYNIHHYAWPIRFGATYFVKRDHLQLMMCV